MKETYASDQSLLHIALERENPEHEREHDGIAELLSTIEALTQGWLQPLGLGFQVVFCNPDEYFEEVGRPDASHHFLRQAQPPGDVIVREGFSDSKVEEVDVIDMDATRRAITRSLEQPSPPGALTTLAELKWTAVRALAPTTDPIDLRVVGMPVSTVCQLIDDQLWYYGPTDGAAGPPIRLRAVNEHFAIRIQLDVFWELWIRDEGGRALLEAGVDRVLARTGWQRRGQPA